MYLSQIIRNFPKIFKHIDSIALFGSTIRGDMDRLSDLDTLLISSDWHSLNSAKNLLQNYGFSCSCYNWEKLIFMTKKKALFIQHLKQESYIIKDKGCNLVNLLVSYEPAPNYDTEINLTKKLASITEYFPNNPIGIGWALDILAVSFRNFAILSLANQGEYIFSYYNLIEALLNRGYIGSSDQKNLSKLREYKSSYRNRKFNALPKKDFVFSVQNTLADAFEVDIKPQVISELSFQHYCLFSEKAIGVTNWYFKTRLCEGAFLTWLGLASICNGNQSKPIREILKLITNPNCYSFSSNSSEGDLRFKVIDLIHYEQKIAA